MARATRRRTPAGLTPKQERFCLEYLKDLNATQAAIRAGYTAHTADRQASRLLGYAEIGARVATLQAATARKLEVDRDLILRGFLRIASADLRRVMQTDPETGETTMRPVHEWPDDLALAVSAVKVKAFTPPQGRPYQVVQINLESRTGALTKLGQHLGLFREVPPPPAQDSGVLQVPMPIGADAWLGAAAQQQAALGRAAR